MQMFALTGSRSTIDLYSTTKDTEKSGKHLVLYYISPSKYKLLITRDLNEHQELRLTTLTILSEESRSLFFISIIM